MAVPVSKKIELFKQVYGIDVMSETADTWLEMAISAEQTAEAVGPFDPAYMRFRQDLRMFIEAAELRELAG